MRLLPARGVAVLAFYDLREAGRARACFAGGGGWETDLTSRFIAAGELAQVRVACRRGR